MIRSSTKELFTPFKDPKREFRSSRKHFKTLSLEESRSPDFDLFSDQEEYSKEEVAETMAETTEQYMSKTRADYGSGVNSTYLGLRKKYRLNLKNDMPPRITDLCMTITLTKELFTPFKDPEREFRSSRKHFKTLSLEESRSPDFDLFSDQEEYSEEEVAETMVETMEQCMSKTRADYGSGVVMTSNNVYFIASFCIIIAKNC
ncbi:hypothetical protein Tco_1353810 [Tanacetum coccineum]